MFKKLLIFIAADIGIGTGGWYWLKNVAEKEIKSIKETGIPYTY